MEKKETNVMLKIANIIVDKRNLIFLVPIYICVSVYQQYNYTFHELRM